jgi:malate/lactate dehydrogenase
LKTVVVGNPANTNCLIAAHHAKDLPSRNFTAMTRLDHSRALHQLCAKTNSHMYDVSKFCIWGNHSPTMYPDLSHCTVNGKNALDLVTSDWMNKDFIPTVQ